MALVPQVINIRNSTRKDKWTAKTGNSCKLHEILRGGFGGLICRNNLSSLSFLSSRRNLKEKLKLRKKSSFLFRSKHNLIFWGYFSRNLIFCEENLECFQGAKNELQFVFSAAIARPHFSLRSNLIFLSVPISRDLTVFDVNLKNGATKFLTRSFSFALKIGTKPQPSRKKKTTSIKPQFYSNFWFVTLERMPRQFDAEITFWALKKITRGLIHTLTQIIFKIILRETLTSLVEKMLEFFGWTASKYAQKRTTTKSIKMRFRLLIFAI